MGKFFYILLSINTFIYGIHCFLGYKENLRSQWYYGPVLVFISIVGNTLWVFYLKSNPIKEKVFFGGMLWDLLLTLSYVIVPLVFTGIKLNSVSYIGLFLLLTGITILKYSMLSSH